MFSLKERNFFSGIRLRFFFSTSIRDFKFGVILHAMLGVQSKLMTCLGFSISLLARYG